MAQFGTSLALRITSSSCEREPMAVVNAQQSVVTSLSDVKEQRLDLQLRQLEFNALLHRKLDLELLLESFMSEAQAFVPFDGLQYQANERGRDLLVGDMRQHRQQFELKLGDASLGELCLMRAKDFSSREQRDSERLVESLIYPLENALEHHSALMASMTDKVSGVHNQLALEQQLPREIRLARRAELPLAVMLITVDYLESISEHHGSAVGEQAWQSVAEALAEQLRESDVIFRTELDEFLIVLNHTDLDGALALSERLRQQVDRAVSYDNVQFVLTASAGVTALDAMDDSDALVNRARQALSLARQAGRNQIKALPAEVPDGFDDSPDGGSVA